MRCQLAMGWLERLWPPETEHDRVERVRAMRFAWPLILAAGALNLLQRPTWEAAVIWTGWTGLQAALAALARRGDPRRAQLLGTVANVAPSFAVAGLVAVTPGELALVGLIALAAVPMIDSLFAVPDVGGPLLAGLAGLLLGLPLVPRVLGGFAAGGWAWALGVVGVTAVAAAQSHARRMRREAEVRAERERAEAVEALAETRLARVDGEALASLGVLADEVSHEVNSPLAAVKASLEFAGSVLPPGNDELAEALRDGLLGVERIRLIVARLQALQRGVAGRRYPRPLREASLDAIRIAEPWLVGRAEVTNEVGETGPLEAPWSLVVEMVACLLLQGATRTPDGRPTRIRVRGEADDARLVVQVDAPRLHAPQPVGLGHGLAICTEYARRLGGGLVLEQRPEGGAHYRLAIPLGPGAQREPAAAG